MTITVYFAYLIVLSYIILERALRKGENATSLQTGESDRGSSQIIWIVGTAGIVLLIIAPILNSREIGYFNSSPIAWLGIVNMLCGLCLRCKAALILGEFYTRTLQIVEEQTIVTQAPYNIIRHPGYFGTYLIDLGVGLALNNWIVTLIMASLGILWRIYRLETEEEMLADFFGEQYEVYQNKTWKLVPFVY